MGFFNFGNDDKKEKKVISMPQENPYTENGLVLKRVPVEKGVMGPGERDSSDLRGLRSNRVGGLFGTTDLDYILRAYAPDTMDLLDNIISNQKRIHNDIRAIKQENHEIKEMLGKLLQEKDLINGISR